MSNIRPAALLVTAALALSAAVAPQAALAGQLPVENIIVLDGPSKPPTTHPCPLNATTCIPGLPDIPRPGHGGGETPHGPGGDGVDKDTYCNELKAAMGSSADTPTGKALLQSFGC